MATVSPKSDTPGPLSWDSEKQEIALSDIAVDVTSSTSSRNHGFFQYTVKWLSRWGIETNGITPVPPGERTDTRLYQIFFVWFSANANILTFGAGTVGPVFFNIGMRGSMLVVIVVDIIACAFPAYFAVFGPKLGTRAMVQARFSWGYYGTVIPSILNVVSMQGYLIINCIIGGQTLAGISDNLTDSVGIVIISLISLAVTFCGYRVLHWYESVAWIPNVISFVVMLGVGGKQLANSPLSSPAPIPPSVFLTFGATLAATVVSWSTLTPDQGVYHDTKASTWRIFSYAYLGFFASSVPAHLLGAAFASAALSVPAWQAGLGNGNDVGGLIAAILQPTGGFGKFLLVLLSLTTPSACAPTMYTVCTSLMTIAPFFARIPRSVIAIISTAVLIPVAIVCDTRFYATFVQILSFIGYWLAPFIAIIFTEHFLFRRNTWERYEVERTWDKSHLLPRGYAAICTFAVSIGIVVLCMDQEWWVGPVARAGAGDIGMMVGFISGVLVYSMMRQVERRWKVGENRFS